MKWVNFVSICFLLTSLFTTHQAQAAPHKNTSKQPHKNLILAYQKLFPVSKSKNNTHKVPKKLLTKRPLPRYQATQIAKQQIRKKYRWGGSNPRTGFDCSGLTQYAYKSVKINLPRTARAQYKHTKRIPLAHLQVGDLIFFHTRRTRQRVNHVGIYLGAGQFIHAPRKGKRVSIARLNHYWRKKAVGAGRV